MLLMRTVAERALPFDPLTPNEETVEAMKAARRGDLVKVGSIDELIADLHADDSSHKPVLEGLQAREQRHAQEGPGCRLPCRAHDLRHRQCHAAKSPRPSPLR